MPQVSNAFTAAFTDSLNYLLYTPRGYDPDEQRQWPLILFLHGAGQRGEDLAAVKKHGIPRIAEEGDLPFVVISPQCPRNTWWPEHADTLMSLVDSIVASHRVDASRIYVTGLSMGGYGTWHMGVCYPERFAALAPICGGGLWAHGFPERAAALKNVPVWAFHGALDQTVPLQASQELVNVLQAAGGDVRLTVYSDAAHDAWTRTYDDPALYEWFLSHRLDEVVDGS